MTSASSDTADGLTMVGLPNGPCGLISCSLCGNVAWQRRVCLLSRGARPELQCEWWGAGGGVLGAMG